MSFLDTLALGDLALRQLLGSQVTYAPGSGAPAAVQGVFDSAYVLVEQGQVGLSSAGPAVFLRLADLPSDPSLDDAATVTVGGVTYTIREVKPDGTGAVVLLLHRQS